MGIRSSIRLFCGGVLLCYSIVTAADDNTPDSFFAADPVFGSRTYIEFWGEPDEPPVLLVHGLGDNGARDWRHIAPALAESFRVIALDLPGFGRSEKANALYSLDNYARVVDWIASEYIGRPFALIGHSMGGAIALNYAASHSQRLTRLILIDVAGVLHRTAFTKHLIDEAELPGGEENNSGGNLAALNALLGFSLEDIDRYSASIDAVLLSPIMRGTLLAGDPGMIAGLALVQHNFSGQLGQVTVPTLLIWGAEDNVAPLRTGRLLAHRLPKSRLEIIEGVGHMPMYQSAQRLNALVLEELNGAADRGPAGAVEPVYAETAESATCDGQDDLSISGRYVRVEIVNCRRVLIENSRIERLVIRNSSVEIMASEIVGVDVAMEAHNSRVWATATDFEAERPILVNASRLDFAGVKIRAGSKPFQVEAYSTVLFSVSNVRTPQYGRHVHGAFDLSPDANPF